MKKPARAIDPASLPAEAIALIEAGRKARMEAEKQAEKAKSQALRLAAGKARLAGENARLVSEKARLIEEKAHLAADKARLEYLVREFRRALYGRKSEKISPDQLELALEDLQTSLVEAETARQVRAGASGAKKKAGARKRNIGHLPQELERIERVITPENIQCPCGCGEMVKIREERSERLDIEPARFRVIVTIRPVYACPKSCGSKPVQAAVPARLIESGLPTEALIAHVIVSKFADHCVPRTHQ